MSLDPWPSSSSSLPPAAADVTFLRIRAANSITGVTTASGSSDNGSGKNEPREHSSTSTNSYPVGSGSRQAPKTGGFLIGRPHTPAEKRGTRKNEKSESQVGNIHGEKGSLKVARTSEEPSHGTSPLWQEISADHSIAAGGGVPTQPQMDPAQLVRMALDLSESRRRNVSALIQGTLPPVSKVNQSGTRYGSVRSSKRETVLREDWRHNSASPKDSGYILPTLQSPILDLNGDISFDFSPATLSRAEKARKYFELANEHRKLLEYLPPINASRNEGPVAGGRAFNPLQSLRNRRLRTREKRPFTAPVDTWQDLDIVKDWIANVELVASGYGKDQPYQLPIYPGDGSVNTEARNETVPMGHLRTNTANSTIMRPENGWTVDPPELLADTYWTEQTDNKFFLEDRKGDRMITSRVPEAPQQAPNFVCVGGDSEQPPKREGAGRPARLQKPFPRNQAPSVNSVSSNEPQNHLNLTEDEVQENIGPLELHMQEMIHEEERGELNFPGISPIRWDMKQIPVSSFDTKTPKDLHNTHNLSIDSNSQHRRTPSDDGRAGRIPLDAMSSAEDFNSDEPSSPVITGFVLPMGMDLNSPPPGVSPLRQQKSRFHRLPKFRGHSKERNNLRPTDFAAQQSRTSLDSFRPSHQTHQQTESWTGNGSQRRNDTKNSTPRTSLDSSRPFEQRHKSTESWGGSLRRQETTSVKEPSSTVGRFFKGGRIGDLVRHESSRLGDRMRSKDEGSERWNDENGVTSGDSETSPRTSLDPGRTRPRYNIPNLPSFKPPGRDKIDSDPIGRQQRAQREVARPSRFGMLSIHPPGDSATNDDHSQYHGNFGGSHDSLASLRGARSISIRHAAKGEQRHWSISDRRQSERDKKITMRDIARAKALLMSSGIKAREIQRSADKPRREPLLLIQKVSNLVGRPLNPVSKREEHQIAARALTDDLNKSLSEFESTVSSFQNGSARSLASDLGKLQQKASDHLTKLVHETSDEADAFTVELTTRQPQDIKRIDDAIDNMLRRRRRQFRALRRTGFKLLEWMVLSIMWWIWFIVVLFNTMRRLATGAVSFVKWLVWF
ncbi:Hypothetical protein R9X50_00025200 [Acrodontium crateriforme]|uniref:Uncharacterized protein n=1 Tax=Acrodontium crateriforme TaxID=150365 RepID=A0AAQ3LWX3_9PEZI|nr:Hypothetical protein R9X50_00025200 [Acrodontium crateriforme]